MLVLEQLPKTIGQAVVKGDGKINHLIGLATHIGAKVQNYRLGCQTKESSSRHRPLNTR